MIKMYSTGCPKCNVLKKKLDTHGIKYEIITDINAIQKIGEEHNINTVPILEANGKIMDFKSAVKWLERSDEFGY